MGAVDCPGPRWIGCRIKGSPILTTRAQSHTCKGQRKEIHPLLLEIFESTTSIQNVATFWRPKPLHIGVTLALLLCFYYISEDHHHTDQLVMIRACLGGQDLLLFVW